MQACCCCGRDSPLAAHLEASKSASHAVSSAAVIMFCFRSDELLCLPCPVVFRSKDDYPQTRLDLLTGPTQDILSVLGWLKSAACRPLPNPKPMAVNRASSHHLVVATCNTHCFCTLAFALRRCHPTTCASLFSCTGLLHPGSCDACPHSVRIFLNQTKLGFVDDYDESDF